MSKDDYVYTASGELCEYTFGTYEEAFEELTQYNVWGVVLKHLPFSFEDERTGEVVVYEHLPHLKP